MLPVSAIQATVSETPTISTKGSLFFSSDGNQFYVKGKNDARITTLLPQISELIILDIRYDRAGLSQPQLCQLRQEERLSQLQLTRRKVEEVPLGWMLRLHARRRQLLSYLVSFGSRWHVCVCSWSDLDVGGVKLRRPMSIGKLEKVIVLA